MERVYRGIRKSDGSTAVTADGRRLTPRTDLRQMSAQFEWDASEAGPSQLALAILADLLRDDERALALYPEVKRRLISGLPPEGWILTAEQVQAVVRQVDSEKRLARLERQLGYVLKARCEKCGRTQRFWAVERMQAAQLCEGAGWLERLKPDGSVVQVCPDCVPR